MQLETPAPPRRLLLVALALLVGTTTTLALANPQDPPPGKRTTLGLYLTADEAYDLWRADSANVTVLDVRTPEEYILIGHAPMAWNVPVAALTYGQVDGEFRHGMEMGTGFVDRVRTLAGPDDVLVVMCRSGGRSARAVDLLAAAGFTRVYNVTDGVEGDKVKDPASAYFGKRMVNGWKNRGLPWVYAVDPGKVLIEEGKGR